MKYLSTRSMAFAPFIAFLLVTMLAAPALMAQSVTPPALGDDSSVLTFRPCLSI